MQYTYLQQKIAIRVLTNMNAYANLNTSFKKHKNISKKQIRAVYKKRRASMRFRASAGQSQYRTFNNSAKLTARKRALTIYL